MTEGVPPTGSIAEGKVASAVVQISLAVEQMSELLEAANGLHQQLVKLLAVLTEALVDLEPSLREPREEAPNQSD
jgi:hypothetical protein